MARFTFTMQEEESGFGENDEYSTEVSFAAETHDEVIMWFDQFLKGCGFIYNGEVMINDVRPNPQFRPQGR